MKLHHEADIIGGSIAGNLYSRADQIPQASAEPADGTKVDRLPFTVRVVRSETDLAKAVSIRQSAYARHVPEFAERLSVPEAADHAQDSVVLLAESKLDGTSLGTMRIQTNARRPLALEQSVELPRWLQGRSLAEATRLGISLGREGKLVKATIFKAFLLYCLKEQIDWMVITARAPLDRQYDALLFEDVFPGGAYIPMAHVGNIPHRVLALAPEAVETRWRKAKHPLFDYFFQTRHRDIKLDAESGNAEPQEHSWFGAPLFLQAAPA